jgi:hypothetical protein
VSCLAGGMEGLHFHDLRHAGNHLAAASGAGLKDLMTRMGHDNGRAALICQNTRHEGLTSGSRMRSTSTSRPSGPRATTAVAGALGLMAR